MTADVQVRVDVPVRGLLPVGIPLGWDRRPGQAGYAVRRAGQLFMLSPLQYEIWRIAHACPPRDEIGEAVTNVGSGAWDGLAVATGCTELLEAGLLLEMKGEPAQDWLPARELRPIPRAIPREYSAAGAVFELPASHTGVYVDALSYLVWSLWDGTRSVRSVAGTVVDETGYSPAVVREISLGLLAGGTRMPLLFLDHIRTGAAGPVSWTGAT
jgi:hypothetical protein